MAWAQSNVRRSDKAFLVKHAYLEVVKGEVLCVCWDNEFNLCPEHDSAKCTRKEVVRTYFILFPRELRQNAFRHT